MSKTIAINAGSSSLKWQLYAMPEEEVLAKGIIERIGLKDSISTVKFDGRAESQTLDIVDHVQAVKLLLADLLKFGIIGDYSEITGVGHRVVAGGEFFTDSVLIDDAVLAKIEDLASLAPLHNPANAAGIRAFKEILPDITSVAVFDTAFHTTLPEVAYRYPIAEKYYTDYQVRKYGAHGTSHYYVSHQAAEMLGRPLEELKLVTAHIGNGISISAIDGGKSVDTSMGFTPLAGPMMGTRSGDIDPAIIPYLIEQVPGLENAADVIDVLNKESGVLGVAETSSDMRDVEAGREAGDAKMTLAFDMLVDRLRKFIGQYFAVLNGADALVFTAGIGENSNQVRQAVVDGLSWFGMELEPGKNVFGAVGDISTADSKVKVLVVPTDEELVIARDVERLKA
ncbi:acetate kinase [Streptococcus sp. NLN76]|uniref:acetate kinase n=1 Tax=Streptococcus sp. NLN76 TaxID=2822800 RepID=UPI0018A964C4|nr:acetate kinase [Streptococcus sp. NLN76]MBF8969765.1 acetate kinase [Streptococcus sp. NLN76]